MNPIIRLRRDLFDLMLKDFERPHNFAYERVGFLYGRLVLAGSLLVVLPTEYRPVPDEQYRKDDSVGAMIDEDALFEAHNRTSLTGLCCLHVHSHGGRGRTWFSRTDLKTLRAIGPSLQRLARQSAHGGLVLTNTSGASLLWLPNQATPTRGDVSIVGFPMSINRGKSYEEPSF